MKSYRFVIPGKAVGYVATTKKSKFSKEYRRYADYAAEVRRYASAAGVPVPLFADEENQLIVKTIAYFPNRVHCDPGNVQKGVCDALFYDEAAKEIAKALGTRGTGKGDDKQTGGSFPPPRYDKANPRVVVIIKPYRKKIDDLRYSERDGKRGSGKNREDDSSAKREKKKGAADRKPGKAVHHRQAPRRKKARG